ncbi:MAG: exodeoxyribonuclease III [Myxococcota bacterium]
MSEFTIWSWNVNGLRACGTKGFERWLQDCGGDLVAVQEVRAFPHQLEPTLREPPGWHAHFAPAQRPGYSGVGIFARQAPDHVHIGMDAAEFDDEGRLLTVRLGRLTIANGYFPNGNGSTLPDGKRSNDRVPYKLAFYQRLFDRLEPLRAAGEPVLVVGDFNTAHRELDLARPKANVGTSGFLPQERAELDRWLGSGWTDTFRHQHPDEPGHYSWWSQRFGVRAKNIGWRLDYVLASQGAMRHLQGAFIAASVTGSDHCPVGATFGDGILRQGGRP